MKNAKLIAGLEMIQKGLTEVITSLKDETNAIAPTVTEETKADAKKGKVTNLSEKRAEKEKTEKSEGVSKEELDAMSYNNLKKYAKELGLSANGNRDDITARILGGSVEAEVEEEVDDDAEVENTEEEVDDIRAQVEEAVSELSLEELAGILTDAGLSPKGKREALVDRIVVAVAEGKIAFDDDDEEEEEDEEEEVKKPSKSDKKADKKSEKKSEAPKKEEKSSKKKEVAPEPVEEDDDDEDDGVNDLDNPDMTKKRKKAIKEKMTELTTDFEDETITRDDVVEFLQEFYESEDDMSEYSDEDLLDTYIDAMCRMIDDDGDLVEEGSYTVNGVPFCCGKALKYVKKSKKFVCESCGEEYGAE